jgi:hypothetical protein
MNGQTLRFQRSLRPGPIALSALLFLAAAAGTHAAPHLVVDQPDYDFGTVSNGQELLHDFVVRNTGDAELDLTRVASSCASCLQALIETATIPPGGRSLLHARLETRLLDGPVFRVIWLYSNDPRGEPLPVQLSGTVVPVYQVAPRAIDIDLSQGEPTGSAEIVTLVDLRAPLSRVECADPRLAALLSRDEAGRYVISVSARGSFPRGITLVAVTLRTADAGDPPCRVTCIVHNPPDLELIPERLLFIAAAEPQVRILWLRQHGSSPVILLDALPPSDHFRCEIEPDPADYDYRIYITAWGQEAAAGRSEVLVLKVRDQRGAEHEVRVPLVVEKEQTKTP